MQHGNPDSRPRACEAFGHEIAIMLYESLARHIVLMANSDRRNAVTKLRHSPLTSSPKEENPPTSSIAEIAAQLANIVMETPA